MMVVDCCYPREDKLFSVDLDLGMQPNSEPVDKNPRNTKM